VTKRLKSKHKISRRLGADIWGSHKYKGEKSTPPGQHGNSGMMRRTSDYGAQLQAKQKLKGHYGNISEKQFSNLYKLSVKLKGDTGQNLIGLLERRLDAVIYRANLVPTVFSARQFVNHKHITVNGKTVNIASYRVSVGDVIAIKAKSQEIPVIMQSVQDKERTEVSYLEVDYKKMEVKFVAIPAFTDVPYSFELELSLVIEYYSR
jgi:small subunit ribosomal protein S4